MQVINRDEIVQRLKETICMVVFEKKDGTIREMKCTLNSIQIPTVEQIENKEKRTKSENPDVLPVYDVEAKGWRSFRWDSIREFRDTMNL
jgi:hypothetical protein